MRSSDPLVSALALLRPRIPRLLLAIAVGVLSLGSALALAGGVGVADHPGLADAACARPDRRRGRRAGVGDFARRVRLLRAAGLPRHRAARGGHGQGAIYARLAGGRVDTVMRRPSGELVTRVGADVDHVADALVRGIIPIGVAAVLACAGTAMIAMISPAAAIVMAGCMLVAGVIAPWLAARAATGEEAAALQHHSARDVAAMAALDHAPELRVSGRLDDVIAECQRQQCDWGYAADRAARSPRRSRRRCRSPRPRVECAGRGRRPASGCRTRSRPPRSPC